MYTYTCDISVDSIILTPIKSCCKSVTARMHQALLMKTFDSCREIYNFLPFFFVFLAFTDGFISFFPFSSRSFTFPSPLILLIVFVARDCSLYVCMYVCVNEQLLHSTNVISFKLPLNKTQLIQLHRSACIYSWIVFSFLNGCA